MSANLINHHAMHNLFSNRSASVKASLALGLMLVSLAEARAAGPFTVNTINDTHAAHATTSPDDANANISLRSAIEAANAQAGATTINVPAGTYTLNLGELDVSPLGSKIITISGAGASATMIIQGDNFNRVFNIDSNSAGGSTATLTGLTIQGGTDKADNFGGAGILAGSLSAATLDVLTLQNCVIQDNHCQALDSSGNPGGGVSMEGGNLIVTTCTFAKNSSGSSQGGGLFFFPQNVASSLQIVGSLFIQNSNVDVTGFGIGGGAICVGSTGTGSSHSITGSTFISNSVTGTVINSDTYGAIQVQDGASVNFTISASTFLDNTVTSVSHTDGLGGALAVNSGQVSVNFCRFFDNIADAGSALFSSVSNSASVNAVNNWWGCNAGPGASGCDSITGDGTGGSFGSTVTFSPWIVMTLTPNPPAIQTGGSAVLTASFLQNSAAATLSAANVSVLDGLPIAFDSPVLGTLSGAQTSIQPGGTATVLFTAGGSPGTGHASAAVDNASVTANISINSTSLTITTNPIDTSICSGDTAVFTAAATGSPTPTLQWQVSSGGGPFTDISGATTSPLSITALAADNGNQYRAVFNNGTIADSGAATLTVYSPPVAGADSLGTTEGVPVNAPVAKLLVNDSSPIGGALSIIGVISPSTANGTVVLNGQFITYTPAAGFFGSDSFTYTLSDTRCTAEGTVNVTVTSTNAPSLNKISITLTVTGRVVVFAGVPGITYVVQEADSVAGPWTDFTDGSIVAGPTGLIQYTDSTSPIPSTRFYRTRVGP
jgi:hypothetical protein